MEQRPYVELRGIHKTFPGVYALKDVSLSVFPGEIHGLVGENGAGKSTLIKILAGCYEPNGGEYWIQGNPGQIHTPMDAIEKGVAVVYQELNVVDSLSVAENIYFGRLPRTALGRVKWKQLYRDTEEILRRLGLSLSPRQKAGYLSIAQKQLVEIARCISMNPRVVIMDEPTSALAPAEIQTLLGILKKLKGQQVGILYISHKLEEIMELCDRITVLRDGQFVKCVEKQSTSQQELICAMVGRELGEMFSRNSSVRDEIALEVESLTTCTIKNASFSVRKGEIAGFCGLMGAGRTELARAVYGEEERLCGIVRIEGKELKKNSRAAAVRMGVGFIPEDRKKEGIFQNLSVKKNITVAVMEECSRQGILSPGREAELARSMIARLRIKTPTPDQLMVNLSGGNQQKGLIARWLAKKGLKVLIVDEPTRGIDVGAKAEIYALLDELAREGLAVLVMSSEMPEILGMCDRIYVMKKGCITAEYSAAEATQEKLLASAI